MRKNIDTILLAVALFCISGAVLAYNMTTADGDIAVSLSELAGYDDDGDGGSLLSIYSELAVNANLNGGQANDGAAADDDNVAVNAGASEGFVRSYELLGPIITKPSE